jgi:NAD(P)-dependent dehydrogenase (short-subunit alcohol dehydrogenase family)
VASFLDEIERRNICVVSLVNNAGTISTDSMRVNHLGHFALTLGLIPALQRGAKLHRGWLSCIGSGGASVVNVASVAHIEGAMTIANWTRRAVEAAAADEASCGAFTISPNKLHDVKNSASLWEPQRSGAWSEYALSKCANVVFSNSLSTRFDSLPGYSGIRVASYHPGVMASDLWTSGEQRNASNSFTREWLRKCLFLCVKHPCMSAAGLASLANPRVGFSSSSGSNYMGGVEAMCCTAFMGDSGGYYQQGCQLCVVPVRAMPPTHDRRVQEDLWRASLAEVKQRHASLGRRLQQVDEQFSQDTHLINSDTNTDGLLPQQQHCQCRLSPALPCSEILTAMPYCVCLACLF